MSTEKGRLGNFSKKSSNLLFVLKISKKHDQINRRNLLSFLVKVHRVNFRPPLIFLLPLKWTCCSRSRRSILTTWKASIESLLEKLWKMIGFGSIFFACSVVSSARRLYRLILMWRVEVALDEFYTLSSVDCQSEVSVRNQLEIDLRYWVRWKTDFFYLLLLFSFFLRLFVSSTHLLRKILFLVFFWLFLV